MNTYTFNDFLKTLFIILTLFCLLRLLPDNYEYRIYFDKGVVLFRHSIASILFLTLAYRLYFEEKQSLVLIYMGLALLYQPFLIIKLGEFSPYLDVLLSVFLTVDILNFKQKKQLIEWLKIKKRKNGNHL